MEGETGRFVRVLPALSRDGVLLIRKALLREQLAVLEDGGGVAEDEVHRAGDLAFSVELTHRVGVEAVLVAEDPASVEDGEVGVGSERDGLVLLRAGGVLEGQVSCNEPSAANSCTCVARDMPQLK